MSEPELCQRCREPLIGNRAVLFLETRVPGSKRQEMTICGHCLESYLRWATRPQRLSDARAASSNVLGDTGKPSGRGHKTRDSASPAGRWKRLLSRKRLRRIGILALILLATYAVIAIIAY